MSYVVNDRIENKRTGKKGTVIAVIKEDFLTVKFDGKTHSEPVLTKFIKKCND